MVVRCHISRYDSLAHIDFLWHFRSYGHEIFVPKIQLNTLFEHFGLESVDILMMDIEGTEFEVFEKYDWKIKPRQIYIEAHELHDGDDKNELFSIILNQGYTLKWTERYDSVVTQSSL